MDHARVSKFIALVLRHDPSAAGVTLDHEGWADVAALLAGLEARGFSMSRDGLGELVAADAKKRYAFSDDGLKIRANQGHSVEVDLALTPRTPPDVLYHGTATRFRGSIEEKGLLRMARRHVHLSADQETAESVGKRHGKPWVIVIDARRMHAEGAVFFLSDNGVWLTESVPAKYFVVQDHR